MALGLHALGDGILMSNVFLVFPSSPLLEGPAEGTLVTIWLNSLKFQPSPDGETQLCGKQVKASFKMLLAVFLSLDNYRCSRFPFSKIFSKTCQLYDIMIILKTKGPFPIRVISHCDYFNHIVGTLPLNSILLRVKFIFSLR